MSKQILNPSQAESVYSAMCHLNNVDALLVATIDARLRVRQAPCGTIHVLENLDGDWEPCEVHESQAAFAAAYGLERGESVGL